MKKSDLKRIIKPIVKECILESLVEEGLLSNIITEVVRGVQPSPVQLAEQQAPPRQKDYRQIEKAQQAQQARQEAANAQRKQLLEAINANAYNGVDLFEGTTPISRAGNVGDTGAPNDPLSGVDPGDPGVDISSRVNMSSTWKALVK